MANGGQILGDTSSSRRGRGWSREELLIVLDLYWRIPFGQYNSRNKEVMRVAEAIGRTGGSVAMRLGNYASLDPDLEQRGLQNGSAAVRDIWNEMGEDWDAFLEESTVARQNHGLLDESDPADMADEEQERTTERQVVVIQRAGQDFFRKAVLAAYNYRCCISGLSETDLLIASHIVPWHIDKKNRINPRNGLLLSALHDKAFDRGLITLDGDLIVRVSRNTESDEDRFFAQTIVAYDGHAISPPEKLRPAPEFLAYHREHIFRG